nr:cellulose binding domain-containing protein [Micromonospora sp. DSM 115978]
MRASRNPTLLVATTGVALAAGVGLTVVTAHAAAPGCQVRYTVTNQWQGGFGAEVVVTNLGDPVSSWVTAWSFAAGQTVSQGWNATFTQSGAQVTAASVAHNGALATGASTSFGFNGTWTSTNPVPTGFTVNGTICTGSVTTPTPPPATTAPPTTPPPTTPPPTGNPGQVLAFPGAVGFGARATGGRGGPVYRVTNLADSGPGSFRDAVSQGPRIVVFDVGGYIDLQSPLSIKSNITVAGQTAPGDGIATRGYQVSLSSADNVIVRYMRFRHGLTPNQNRDGITIHEGSNQIFDHVSVSWGRDENFSINSSTNITVQNSIISEGLDPHSCGGLIQSDGVTLFQNLYAHNKTRNPKVKGRNQFVNNVVYNWGSDGYILGDSAGRSDANVVGNYFVRGPSTSGAPFTRGNLNFHIYSAGNYYDSDNDGVLDGRPVTTADLGTVVVEPSPFDFPTIAAGSAATAYQAVVTGAGASLRRDAVDRRVVDSVLRQTGAIITDPAAVDGFGSLAGGTPPADSDRDGMPDAWERGNGLNPANAGDANALGPDGYPNIERYLNSLAR